MSSERGLKRFGYWALTFSIGLQEREIIHPEGRLPQDVAQRDSLPGEHQQDHQGGHFQLLVCQIFHLGFSWTSNDPTDTFPSLQTYLEVILFSEVFSAK